MAQSTKQPAKQQPAKKIITSATSAAAWNQEGFYILPSGNVARLKKPGVLAIACASNGHNVISDTVLARGGHAEAAPQTDAEKAAIIRKNGQTYCEIARLAFVEPRIAPDGVEPDRDAGEIAITDVADDDLYWVYFDFVQGDARSAAPFRVG